MDFHILTLFPEMVQGGLNTSILGRAAQKGLITLDVVNIRDYTQDKHKKVDDYPYGGGAGMLMQAQPVFDAHRAVCGKRKEGEGPLRTVYVTPQGRPFTQRMAQELAREQELVFLCGHYEGVDERVLEEIVTDYVSIGDYVLTGGELPAMVMVDAVSRLIPGVLNNDSSAETESFHGDLLEYPQYSRPEVWRGKAVPGVLLSGNHSEIEKWRLEQAKERTARVRPDLYGRYLEKERLIGLLSRRKRENIHLMELLRRGNGEIIYTGEDGVLLHDRESGAYAMTAEDAEAEQRLLRLVPKQAFLFVTAWEETAHAIEQRFGLTIQHHCYQASYTRREPLPVRHRDIRLLDMEALPYLLERYPHGDEDYMRGRLCQKVMFGLFVENEPAGFIGQHDDGSMGLLFVEPKFRGMGAAFSLEAFFINRTKAMGHIPYCHVDTDNEASLRLQERLGMNLSKGCVWWVAGP